MKTSLLRTVSFVPGEKSPYIFSKIFNPLKMDTLVIRTLSMVPSVCVLTGCDRIIISVLRKFPCFALRIAYWA